MYLKILVFVLQIRKEVDKCRNGHVRGTHVEREEVISGKTPSETTSAPHWDVRLVRHPLGGYLEKSGFKGFQGCLLT